MSPPLEEMVLAKVLRYQSPGEVLFLFGDSGGDLLLHNRAAAAYDPIRAILVGVQYHSQAGAHLPYFYTGDTARETYEQLTAVVPSQDREAPKIIFDIAEMIRESEPHLADIFTELRRVALGTEENAGTTSADCVYDAASTEERVVPCTLYVPERSLMFGAYKSGNGGALISRKGALAQREWHRLAGEFRDPQPRSVVVSNYLIEFAETHYTITEKLPVLNTFLLGILQGK